jgi:pimeloyl-ACP methyl ester carboxylesterase
MSDCGKFTCSPARALRRKAIAAGKLSQDYKDFGRLTFDAYVAAQRKLARVLHAKLVLDTNSGHYIFVEQPELVIRSIRQVVDQVRRQL